MIIEERWTTHAEHVTGDHVEPHLRVAHHKEVHLLACLLHAHHSHHIQELQYAHLQLGLNDYEARLLHDVRHQYCSVVLCREASLGIRVTTIAFVVDAHQTAGLVKSGLLITHICYILYIFELKR